MHRTASNLGYGAPVEQNYSHDVYGISKGENFPITDDDDDDRQIKQNARCMLYYFHVVY